MKDRLFQKILMARQRVYAAGSATPLDRITLEGDITVFLKREDASPIHSYKWRGAYNCVATLPQEARDRGIVAASAGNHAQGVALAARALGVNARIYMPVSAPRLKETDTRRHGGDRVEVILHGDNFDAAAERAFADVKESGAAYIHPFDDLETMGGQGTLADEAVMSGEGPFDVAYLQIGGGGMAAAVSCWMKAYYPKMRIVGVEGIDQASMAAAIAAGKPVRLEYVDVFCDGTAVKQVGEKTLAVCRETIDELITVTNEEVCAAIQFLWERLRCVPEPAGAMGLAGLLKQRAQLAGKKVLSVVCGANLDFDQLAVISRLAGIGAARRRYYRFEIGERPGTMLHILESALDGLNIIDFQYGKVDEDRAWPVIGVEASPLALDHLDDRLAKLDVHYEEITSEEDVEFRIIHYEPDLFRLPYFIKLEFPERAGALHDFLSMLKGGANLCYFSYVFTGEQVGRALMGFEFDSEDNRAAFKKILADSHHRYNEINEDVLRRIL